MKFLKEFILLKNLKCSWFDQINVFKKTFYFVIVIKICYILLSKKEKLQNKSKRKEMSETTANNNGTTSNEDNGILNQGSTTEEPSGPKVIFFPNEGFVWISKIILMFTRLIYIFLMHEFRRKQ